MTNSPEEIVKLIANAFVNGDGVFSNIEDLLEYQVPDGVAIGSAEHARFYFFLIFNDHGTKSSNLYARFKALFLRHPEIFRPEAFASGIYRDPSKLLPLLNGIGLRYPRQAAISWTTNANRLLQLYDGEPLACFTHTHDAPTLFRAIRGFRGYGPKTAGLLLRVIRGVGFNRRLENIGDVPLPVDIHDSRIAFICNLYRPPGVKNVQEIYGSPRHIAGVESTWRNAAQVVDVSWETIDRALWILGSRGCVSRLCHLCPIWKHCDIGRKEVQNVSSLFDDPLVQHNGQAKGM